VFGSAPDTGASVAAESMWISSKYNRFYIEMAVSGANYPVDLNVAISRRHAEPLTFTDTVVDDGMHRYEFDLSENSDWINYCRITPDIKDCVLTVRSMGFEI
jgi:hypothetical protein